VVFDLTVRPLPDVPFPNDLLARADGRSPTGLRLNLSLLGSTELERSLRAAALELDGFSTIGPLTIRFEQPLDLARLSGLGRDIAADPAFLVCLSPGPHFGERVALDLGRGMYPATAVDWSAYFTADPRAGAPSVLLETVDEDRNNNGVLDVGEDVDGDGVLDTPNVLNPGDDPRSDLLTWYERETDTLILRPLVPLRPGMIYAAVLTNEIRGLDGQPIRSPFNYVHHIQQSGPLIGLPEVLASQGSSIEAVAFTWTFTTQNTTRTLEELRAGLMGTGPFETLGAAYPAEATVDRLQGDPDVPGRVPVAALLPRIRTLAPTLWPDADVDALLATYDQVAGLVAGRFVSPALLVDEDGHASASALLPADQDERFRLDPLTGAWTAGRAEVPFWCVVPQSTEAHRPPFPVVIVGLDLGGSRADLLAWAGLFARSGLASCSVAGFGQGRTVDPMLSATLDALDGALQPSPFRLNLEAGRARDLDADGRRDPEGDFLTGDVVHGRDVVRQTVLDLVQFVRVLRGFDGERRWDARWAGGALAGDFDGDGRVDFGGPDVALHATGRGFGGNLAVMLAAIEPGIDRVAPVAAGGGLTDVLIRTAAPALRTGFWLPVMGPMITGRPAPDGGTVLSMLVPSGSGVAGGAGGLPFAVSATLAMGDRLEVTNLSNGEVRSGLVTGDGTVRVGIPASALDADGLRALLATRDVEDGPPATTALGDALSLTLHEADGRRRTLDKFESPVVRYGHTYETGTPLVALGAGFGLRRQTPRLRRFMQVVQTALDPADPVNYAALLGAGRDRDVLFVLTAGDPIMPVSAGLTLARAAGLVDAAADTQLVEAGVVRGLLQDGPLVDPDNQSNGLAESQRLSPPLRRSASQTRASLLRIAWTDLQGAHGWTAPTGASPWDAGADLGSRLAVFLATGVWAE
jgi:hypothetical protein